MYYCPLQEVVYKSLFLLEFLSSLLPSYCAKNTAPDKCSLQGQGKIIV